MCQVNGKTKILPPPKLPYFLTDLNETWYQERYLAYDPNAQLVHGRQWEGGLHRECILCVFLSFLRAKAECFARLSHRLGVCPSVCLSVTLVICIKTVQARITKSLPWAAPRSLVYCDKISCHWVQGFPSNKSVKEGYSLKKMSFCRYWLQ